MTHFTFGYILRRNRSYDQAISRFNAALTLSENDSAVVSEVRHYAPFFIGGCLYEQGKYQESADRYKKLLVRYPDDCVILNNLASSLHLAGHYADAEPLFHRALEILEQKLGAEHPTTRKIRANYQRLLEEIKDKK